MLENMLQSEKFKFAEEEKTFFQTAGIGAIVLFGSRAVGNFRENSDFDIGIIVEDYSLFSESKKRLKLY